MSALDIVLVLVIITLILVIFLQRKTQRKNKEDIKYIYEKLNTIINNDTTEKLMVFTDEEELKKLLSSINGLLNHKQKILTKHAEIEISMRKMLSNISHDLKTPLTVVLGYIETIRLNENISEEERKKLLLKVETKAHEVLELINKFFDLAKLESGDKQILLSPININEVCTKNILLFYDILTSKGFEVSIDIPNKPIFALANEEALDRVINNLISNAVKYGGEGKVLGLKLKSDDSFIYIDVWDRGRGINEIYKDAVFERMYTLDDSRSKENEGSGLGLTITKRLVEKMEGEIHLNSIPYEKTDFTVKLKRVNY
jgi:signal transduction histidine kinase